ncbi:MAG: FHA domain-containing protein [Pseudomonadota bacterium]
MADYQQRLAETITKVLEKKKTIDRELVALYETQKKIATQLETHRHTLEEIKFRNMLGEYAEEEYQKNAKEQQDKISKFETILSSVNTNISRYEDLFKDDLELLALEEKNMRGHEPGEESQTDLAFDEEDLSESEKEFITEMESEDYFTSKDDTHPSDKSDIFNNLDRTVVNEPTPKGNSRIVIIKGDDAGATYPLKDVITFGRADTNTVALKDAKVSRQHAKIQHKGGEYILIDLNSSNGTFVNGEKIDEHVLSNNDEFQIGDSVLQFQL